LEGLEIREIAISKCLQHKDLRLEADFWIQRDNRQAKTIKGCEIIDFVQYGTSKELIEEKEGYPILRLNEFNSRFIGIPSKYCKLISKNDFDSLKLRKNDVLICRTNGNPNLVGRSALVTEDTEYAYASYLFKIRPKKNLINSATLVAFLSCKYGRKEIDKYSMTSNQTNFSPAKFREINVPLFSNQVNSDVEKLYYSAFDKLKYSENNYRQAEELLLETIGLKKFKPSTKGINIKSFKDSFLTTGRLDAEYYQPKYEEIINILTSYKSGFDFLGKLCSTYRGNFVEECFYTDSNSRYAYIRGADISSNIIMADKMTYLNENFVKTNERLVQKGDIVIALIGSVGTAALVTENHINLIVSNNLGFVRINSEKILPEYLHLFLTNKNIGGLLFAQQEMRTAQPKISDKDIRNFPIPLIDNEIQQQIASLIEESFSLRRESERLLEEAKEMVEREIKKGE
jgi:restriction endonuclease S subunit